MSTSPTPVEKIEYQRIWPQNTQVFRGLFKMIPNACGWKPDQNSQQIRGSPQTVKLRSQDIASVTWRPLTASIGAITIVIAGGQEHRFAGFPSSAKDELKNFLAKHMTSVVFNEVDRSVNGRSWGDVVMGPTGLVFLPESGNNDKKKEKAADKPTDELKDEENESDDEEDEIDPLDGEGFEIPFGNIKQVTEVGGKDELGLEFVTGEEEETPALTAVHDRQHILQRIRFYVSPNDDGSHAAHDLAAQIKEHASTTKMTEKGFVQFPKLTFNVPHGKYDLEFFESMVMLRGASYNFKIHYKDINDVIILEKPDKYETVEVADEDEDENADDAVEENTSGKASESETKKGDVSGNKEVKSEKTGEEEKKVKPIKKESSSLSDAQFASYFCVLRLSRPLRQGNQKLSELVMSLDNMEQLHMTMQLTDSLKQRLPDLSEEMVDTEYGFISMLLARMTKLNLVKAGTSFVLKDPKIGEKYCMQGFYKTNSGSIYPLSSMIVFVPRPVLILPLSSIALVSFKRVSKTRQFEFSIQRKSDGPEIDFTSIPRTDYDAFVRYLREKKVPITTSHEDDEGAAKIDIMDLKDDDDEENDDDYNDEDEEKEENGKEKNKKESKSDMKDDDDDDDDEEEDDEDRIDESELKEMQEIAGDSLNDDEEPPSKKQKTQ